MATASDLRRRQQEEQARKRREAEQKKQQQTRTNPLPQANRNKPNTAPKPQANKPQSQPAIGTRRADGKVWSGQNYGYQTQATHNQLKEQGKFRTGTQAIDRVVQTVGNAIPKPIKQYAAAVAADQQRQAARQDRQIRAVAGNKVANLAQNDATGKTIEAASKATNVDNRIVGAAANLAQAAVAKKLMPQGGPQLRPQANRAQLQPRSVGAAARPPLTQPQGPTTRRLQAPTKDGVIKPPAPKPQVAKPEARTVSFPNGIQRGEKNFTPARRAQAVQRANARDPVIEKDRGKTSIVRQNPLSSMENYQTRGAGNRVTNDINFDRTINQKRGPEHHFKSRSETGAPKVSKGKRKLESAAVKDLTARTVADVEVGQSIKTKPYDRARGRMYNRDSNGALRPNRVNEIQTQRKGPTTWKNSASQNREWDPNDLAKPLQKLADSKATRVSSRIGGTSNVKARISPAKNTLPKNRKSVPNPKTQATQVGKPLGGDSKKIAFQNTYHGTSARDAKSIRENGYRPSATGVYGNNQVYTGNKKMAQQYASSAGVRAGDKGAVLRHRVPKKNQQNVPFEKPERGQRVSPQAGLVSQRLREGKTTRIDYGKGSQVTPLTKAQADKTLVPANGNIRLSKEQIAKLRAKPETKKAVRLQGVQRGEKNFTPARRALAAQRANQRASNTQRIDASDGSAGKVTRTNKATGTQLETNWKRHPAPQKGRDLQLELRDLKAGENGRRANRGSRFKRDLRSRTAQDMVGRELRGLRTKDRIQGSYGPAGDRRTAAKARLGDRWSEGVLRADKDGKINSTTFGTGKIKNAQGHYNTVPDMGGRLDRLAKSNITRLGRPAGGTSKATMQRTSQGSKLRNAQGVKYPAKPKGTDAVVGKPLGGESKKLAFQRLYHGTTPEARKAIEANGFKQGTSNVYGKGIYTSSSRNIVRNYSSRPDDTAVVRLRVPKSALKQTEGIKKSASGKPLNVPRVALEARRAIQGRKGKGAQIKGAAQPFENVNYFNRAANGAEDYTVLNKDFANKHIVKGPNNRFYPATKAQGRAIKANKFQPQSDRRGFANLARSEAKYFTVKPHQSRYNKNNVVRNISAALDNRRGGFTVDPHTGKTPGRGYQVAIDGASLRNATPEGVKKFVEKNRELLSRPDVKVGGWTDPKTGKTTIELSRRVRSKAEAERLGKKFDQKAIYDNKTGQVTETGGRDSIRFTKGAQTEGGSRIGGDKSTKRLANLPNTIKKPQASTSNLRQSVGAYAPDRTRKALPTSARPANTIQAKASKRQRVEQKGKPAPLLNRDGSLRRQDGAMRTKYELAHSRNFTPARRAQAVQRANSRINDVEATRFSPAHRKITNNAIGIESERYASPGSGGNQKIHNLNFGNSRQKLKARGLVNGTYLTPRELGDIPKSKLRQKLIDAGKMDMMARQLDIPKGDILTAHPSTPARGRLYNSSTNGALSTRRGSDIKSMKLTDRQWKNLVTDERVRFQHQQMQQDLADMTDSPATRIGRRAGGNSNIVASRQAPGDRSARPKPKAITSAVERRKRQAAQQQLEARRQREREMYDEDNDYEYDDYDEPDPYEVARQRLAVQQQNIERVDNEVNQSLVRLGARMVETTDPQDKALIRNQMVNERFRTYVARSPYNNAREMPEALRRRYHQQAIGDIEEVIRRDNNPRGRREVVINHRINEATEASNRFLGSAVNQMAMNPNERALHKHLREQMIQSRVNIYEAQGELSPQQMLRQATSEIDEYLQGTFGRNR